MPAGDLLTQLCRTIDAHDWDGLATFVSATDGLISSMTEVWTDVAQVPPTGTRPGP